MKRVKARVIPRNRLTLSSRAKMYHIFQSYYDGVTWDQFQNDLSEKTDVILLEHPKDGVCGFSTLLWKRMIVNDQEVIGVYSGDTILEKKYWGSPALGIQFLIYLWKLKLKNLGTPVYWFLISKGYKTYLLMSNNFKDSYPHYAHQTPAFEKALMDRFYQDKFGNHYRSEHGVISFDGSPTCKLKDQVAPITDELKKKVPGIAFFAQSNPNWHSGDELACIARMTLDMPARYMFKKLVLGRVAKLRTPLGRRHRPRLEGERRKSLFRLGPQFRRGGHEK